MNGCDKEYLQCKLRELKKNVTGLSPCEIAKIKQKLERIIAAFKDDKGTVMIDGETLSFKSTNRLRLSDVSAEGTMVKTKGNIVEQCVEYYRWVQEGMLTIQTTQKQLGALITTSLLLLRQDSWEKMIYVLFFTSSFNYRFLVNIIKIAGVIFTGHEKYTSEVDTKYKLPVYYMFVAVILLFVLYPNTQGLYEMSVELLTHGMPEASEMRPRIEELTQMLETIRLQF